MRHGEKDSVLLVEQHDNVRRLTINRPKKQNALSAELMDRLYAEIGDAGSDRGTSVVIIRGAGTSFSAGFDMSPRADSLPTTVPEDHLNIRASALAMNSIWNCPIPLIAQVHGWCLAGATDIAFSCDIVIASKTAQIGHPGVRSQTSRSSIARDSLDEHVAVPRRASAREMAVALGAEHLRSRSRGPRSRALSPRGGQGGGCGHGCRAEDRLDRSGCARRQ